MALAVYKRIRPDAYPLNIGGRMVYVKGGETIVVEQAQMMGVSGFAFVRLYNDDRHYGKPESSVTANVRVNNLENPQNRNFSFEIQELRNFNTQEVPIESLNKATYGVQEVPEVPRVEIIEETNKEIGFSKEIVAHLKSFDNKKWLSLKKDEVIKFFKDAGVTFDHIPNEKWELVKYLKTLIKEL